MLKVAKKINCTIIVFLILMLPIMFITKSYVGLFFGKVYNFNFFYILHMLIPIEIILYLYNFIKNKCRIKKYEILIFTMIILGILVTINAKDVSTSIWGAYSRDEGLLSLLSYYLLFLNARSLDKDEITKIIKYLFGVGIVQFFCCILQIFVRGPYIFGFKSGMQYMAKGFIGNPNMLGSFCSLLVGLSLMLYFLYGGKKYFVLTIIFFINLVLAQSTGPFFAFVGGFIFIIIFLKIKKYLDIKKVIIMVTTITATFLIVSFGTEYYCKAVFNDEIEPSYTIRGDLVNTLSLLPGFKKGNEKEEIKKNYGSGRIGIWKNALSIVPKYFWLGAGIDNFGYVYPQSGNGLYVDKAHNEYLQILVTEGIFILITYLILLFNLFIDGIRNNKKIVWILLSSFIMYAMQAFMNISVTRVAPFYFIIMGCLAGMVTKESDEKV